MTVVLRFKHKTGEQVMFLKDYFFLYKIRKLLHDNYSIFYRI